MNEARVHDRAICHLGEGPLWHPERGELWWFDILGRTLHGPGRRWPLAELSSAMGWVDGRRVLLARRGALVLFDLETGEEGETVAPLCADDPKVRPNDGRADPWGGFWIGTMGIRLEEGRGAIWRWHGGELRRLVAGIAIPNAICFDAARGCAYWTDTPTGLVQRQPLGPEGWPEGEAEVFLDLRDAGLHPDGAVADEAGNVWIAMWGAGRVCGFSPEGEAVGEYRVPARQSSCPAWGGADFSTLFVTSAAAGIPQEDIAEAPDQGRTFAVATDRHGAPEPRVRL